MSGIYITVQGDMWDSIAHSQLGNAAYKDKLMMYNSKYRNYYIFPAGITLVLPDILEETEEFLPPWKQVDG